MSFETSVGTSDADSITVMGRDLAGELTRQDDLHGAGVPARAAAPSLRGRDAAASTPCSSRSPITASRRPCSRRASPIPVRPSRSRERWRPAFWVPDRSFWVSWRTRVRFLDEHRRRRRGRRWRARSRRAGAFPGLGHPVHKVQDPRTPRIYEIAEETGLLGPYLTRLREVAAALRAPDGPRAARSTARASRARRWPIWAFRSRFYAASRCWRGPRGCSVTSRKRCRALLGCVSTARWMSVRSMPRLPGSSGGVQATSGGRQASVRRAGRGRARR